MTWIRDIRVGVRLALAFGLLIDSMGSRILIVSSGLSLAALLALLLLHERSREK